MGIAVHSRVFAEVALVPERCGTSDLPVLADAGEAKQGMRHPKYKDPWWYPDNTKTNAVSYFTLLMRELRCSEHDFASVQRILTGLHSGTVRTA